MSLSTKNILGVVAGLSVALTLMGETSFGRGGGGGGGRGMSMGHSGMGHSGMGHHNMSYHSNFSNHSNRSFTNSNHVPRNVINNSRSANRGPHSLHPGHQHMLSRNSKLMGKHMHHHRGPYWKHYGDWGFGDDSSGFGWDCWLDPECGGWAYYEPVPVDEYCNPYVAADGPVDGVDDAVPIAKTDENADTADDADVYAAARDAFRDGDLNTASKLAAQAVAAAPRNRDVRQFYSLVLFAKKDFRRSAAVAHGALRGGPGWNWNTLRTFYSDPEVYTEGLRSLEHAVGENASAADIRFLLAYHYLMLNHVDSAERQLQQVVEVEPKDKLARRIRQAIGGSDEGDQNSNANQTAADSVKPETIQPESIQPETIQPETIKPKTNKLKTIKARKVKMDLVKSDSAPSNAVESDAVRSDTAKSDTAKSDTAKSDAVKSDAVKSDTVKLDTVKLDTAKSARVKSLSVKTAAHKVKKTNDKDQGDDDDSDDDDEDTTANAPVLPQASTQSEVKVATPIVSTVADPALNGSWKATPADGVQIELTLRADQTFDWKFTSNGKAKEFHGKYRMNGKILALTRNGDGTAMEGTVEINGDKAFRFRMKNADSGDPGISFTPV